MPFSRDEIAKAYARETRYRNDSRTKRAPTLDEIDRKPMDWARVERERRIDREKRNPAHSEARPAEG